MRWFLLQRSHHPRLVLVWIVLAAACHVTQAWLSTTTLTTKTTATTGFRKDASRLTTFPHGRRQLNQSCQLLPLPRWKRPLLALCAVDVGNHHKLLGNEPVESPPSLSTTSVENRSQQQPSLPILTRTIHPLDTKLMFKEQSCSSSLSSSVPLDNSIKKDQKEEDDGLTLQQKAINLLFLSTAFGYAIYTIVNIDHGMTRGWSASEIAMRIPLDNWGAYESYLANKPIVTKTLINVIIYLLGDWLSQTAFQGKNVLDFDISRTLRNGFIGLCFGPLVHQYYEFSDAILPPENGLVTRLEKIVMDQTIYLTVKCSVYISAVGLLAGEEWPTVKQTVEDKIVGIVLTAWKFWPIVHCITYSLIPAQHRILWVNSVDLFWNGLLASMAQKKSSVFEELEGGEEEDLQIPLSAFEVAPMENDDIAIDDIEENLVMVPIGEATGSTVIDDTSPVFMENYVAEVAEEVVETLTLFPLKTSSSNATESGTVNA